MDRYAVFGSPIAHTKSPLIHGLFAAASGQAMAYEAVEPPPGGFRAAALAFRDSGGRGMNITAPFKLEACGLAQSLSEPARLAGAVNALKFEAGRILGENFDGTGLVHDIQRNLAVPLTGLRVLLLGAGGAARGAVVPLLAQSPALLAIVNRDTQKARQLAHAVQGMGPVASGGYAELAGPLGSGRFDIVVNATSASLKGELPPVPAAVFSPGGLAYELLYGKGLTPFLRLAQGAGVRRLADGVGMLVEQAAESFAWWRGVRPATRAVIARLAVPLA